MESLLKVDPGLFLWTIITFALLLFILWKTAWKPIVEALDARAEKVKSDVDRAESNRVESEKLLTQHKENIDKAKDDANKVIAESKTQAEKLKNDMLNDAKEEANNLIEKAKREIDLSKQKALGEIKEEIVNISTDIAAKIIAKNLKPEDQAGLVQEALNNLTDKKIVQ